MSEQHILDEIKQRYSRHETKEAIYLELLKHGATVDDIAAAYKKAQQTNAKTTEEKTVAILITFGAILIGVGIFAFVASNWPELTKTTKVAILIIGMLITYMVGWYLREKTNHQKIGDAFILLGTIFFGANLYLIAQIFNIRVDWREGMLIWLIVALAVGITTENRSNYYGSILIAFVAISSYFEDLFTALDPENTFYTLHRMPHAEMATILFTACAGIMYFIANQERQTQKQQEHRAILTNIYGIFGAVMVVLAWIAAQQTLAIALPNFLPRLMGGLTVIAISYAFESRESLIIGLLAIVQSMVSLELRWQHLEQVWGSPAIATAALGIIYYVVGTTNKKPPYATTYMVIGTLTLVGALFFASSREGIDIIGTIVAHPFTKPLTSTLLIGTLIIAAAILTRAIRQKQITAAESGVIFGYLALFAVTIAIAPRTPQLATVGIMSYQSIGLTTNALIFGAIYNIALLAGIIGIILSGYRRRAPWRINLGAVLIMVFIIVKYTDWFFDFLDKSVFFISAGILLLIIGWIMDRSRRALLSAIHRQS